MDLVVVECEFLVEVMQLEQAAEVAKNVEAHRP